MSRYRVLATALASCGLSCWPEAGTDPAPAELRLVVTPESLAFHGRVGATSLPNRYLTIALAGGAPGRWTAGGDESWLFVLSAGDTVPFVLAVVPRPGGLAAGTHGAVIWVAAGSDTVRVPATLDLAPTLDLGGRWVGRAGSIGIGLDLAHSGTTLAGRGTVSPPGRTVVVAGTFADPSVSLTLAADADTLRFSGSVRDDNALAGTLRGVGATDLALTLHRQ